MPTPTSQEGFRVTPLFREYYDRLGGYNVLGPPISGEFEYEGLDCQFTAAALMVHDPQENDGQRFRLAPIGVRMNIAEPPVPQPNRPDVKYVDGHTIYAKFVSLYEQIGGGLVVGKPLTEVHYNPIRMRYEQYFENVGFYVLDHDSSETVRLLAYGGWLCGAECRKIADEFGPIDIYQHIAPEFVNAVSRLGPTFTGFAISADYLTPDGYLEQVFENIVLVSDPDQPGGVILRPVPIQLGYIPETMVGPKDEQEYIFLPIRDGEKGYNIPSVYLDYLAQHGGLEASGQPIDERRPIKDNVYRQCFQNLCLEEHLNDEEKLRIRPSPLGYKYKEVAVLPVYPSATSQQSEEYQEIPAISLAASDDSPQGTTASQSLNQIALQQPAYQVDPTPTVQTFTDAQNDRQITIQVWETFPMVASNQKQEIGVSVYENNTPMSWIEPNLYVSLPDSAARTYYMFPTGEDGQTRLVLEPIEAENGTIIPYEVCIILSGGQNLCVKDGFMIWQIQ